MTGYLVQSSLLALRIASMYVLLGGISALITNSNRIGTNVLALGGFQTVHSLVARMAVGYDGIKSLARVKESDVEDGEGS